MRDYIKMSKWNIVLKEFVTRTVSRDEMAQKLQESILLLSSGEHSYKICLDERGEGLSSEEFAMYLSKLQVQGKSDISFFIGGARGLHRKLLERSDRIISLGRITLPHKLAQLILVEQIYRAESILANHPYHK